MIHFRWAALLGLGAAGCAKAAPPEPARPGVEIADELPPWMTRGEEVRLAIAHRLLESGNTLGALDIVRQMRSEGYTTGELDLIQGIALRQDGVTSEAERILLDARKRLPRDPRPSAELCVLYADLQQLDPAIDACEKATRLAEASASAWNNLGFLLLSAGRVDEALEAAEKAVGLDSAEPRYRNNLAMAQAGAGREEAAFRTLQSTLPAADAAYMVGLSVERFSGLDPARVWYEKALGYDPGHAEAKSRLEVATDGAVAPVEDP